MGDVDLVRVNGVLEICKVRDLQSKITVLHCSECSRPGHKFKITGSLRYPGSEITGLHSLLSQNKITTAFSNNHSVFGKTHLFVTDKPLLTL